jgi:hypothetical protein
MLCSGSGIRSFFDAGSRIRNTGSNPHFCCPVTAGPAVHAAVQPDLRVLHAVGQQGGRGRHTGRLQHHHLLAREPTRDQETFRGERQPTRDQETFRGERELTRNI